MVIKDVLEPIVEDDDLNDNVLDQDNQNQKVIAGGNMSSTLVQNATFWPFFEKCKNANYNLKINNQTNNNKLRINLPSDYYY